MSTEIRNYMSRCLWLKKGLNNGDRIEFNKKTYEIICQGSGSKANLSYYYVVEIACLEEILLGD